LKAAPLKAWVVYYAGTLAFVSCPVCGAALVHTDTQALCRHVLWHHERGEWPWERM
jgi:hypothetical protein